MPTPPSINKATLDARVRFYPKRGLSRAMREHLAEIPGVWTRPHLEAPFDAFHLVENALRSHHPGGWEVEPLGETGTTTPADRTRALVGEKIWDFLLPFQREAVSFLHGRGGGHLWAPPGSGKTLMSLLFLALTNEPALVVTTPSVTVLRQWQEESEKFLGDRIGVVLLLPPSSTRKGAPGWEESISGVLAAGKTPVCVVGWALIRERWEEILEVSRARSIVFDESHTAKNPQRESWRERGGRLELRKGKSTSAAAFEMARRVPRRVCATATPVPNQIWTDLYAQLSLVSPWAWGRTSRRFEARYCGGTQGKYGWKCEGLTNGAELRRRIGEVSVTVPYEVSHAQLPEKRRRVVLVPSEDLVGIKGGDEKAERKGEKGLERSIQRAAMRKRRAVLEWVKRSSEAGEKVIVFTGRKADCDALGKSLEGFGKVWTAHGSTSQKRRAEIRTEFMEAEGPAVLCGTYQAWGQSINLHDTDLVIFAQLPYTTGQLDQAEGRAHRLGATRPVTYLYLVAEGTVDEAVRDVVLRKLGSLTETVGKGGLGGLGEAMRAMGDREALLRAARCV